MGQHRQLPEGLRQVHPQVPHPLHRDPRLRRDRDPHPDPRADRLPGDDVLVRRDALLHDRPRRGDPAAPPPGRTRSGPGSRRSTSAPSAPSVPLTAVLGGLGTFAAWIVVMALNPRTLAVGIGWMAFGIARLRALPPQPAPAADRDGQGAAARAARGRGDRVPQRPGRLRGRRAVLGGDGRDRGQARLQAPPRHPRPLDADRAHPPAPRRRAARRGRARPRARSSRRS